MYKKWKKHHFHSPNLFLSCNFSFSLLTYLSHPTYISLTANFFSLSKSVFLFSTNLSLSACINLCLWQDSLSTFINCGKQLSMYKKLKETNECEMSKLAVLTSCQNQLLKPAVSLSYVPLMCPSAVSLWCVPQLCLSIVSLSWTTYLPTYLPIYLPSHLPTPTYLPYLPTYLLPNQPTN